MFFQPLQSNFTNVECPSCEAIPCTQQYDKGMAPPWKEITIAITIACVWTSIFGKIYFSRFRGFFTKPILVRYERQPNDRDRLLGKIDPDQVGIPSIIIAVLWFMAVDAYYPVDEDANAQGVRTFIAGIIAGVYAWIHYHVIRLYYARLVVVRVIAGEMNRKPAETLFNLHRLHNFSMLIPSRLFIGGREELFQDMKSLLAVFDPGYWATAAGKRDLVAMDNAGLNLVDLYVRGMEVGILDLHRAGMEFTDVDETRIAHYEALRTWNETSDRENQEEEDEPAIELVVAEPE